MLEYREALSDTPECISISRTQPQPGYNILIRQGAKRQKCPDVVAASRDTKIIRYSPATPLFTFRKYPRHGITVSTWPSLSSHLRVPSRGIAKLTWRIVEAAVASRKTLRKFALIGERASERVAISARGNQGICI